MVGVELKGGAGLLYATQHGIFSRASTTTSVHKKTDSDTACLVCKKGRCALAVHVVCLFGSVEVLQCDSTHSQDTQRRRVVHARPQQVATYVLV